MTAPSSSCKHMLLRNSICHAVFEDPNFALKIKKNEISKYPNMKQLFCHRPACIETTGVRVLDKYPDPTFFENQCSVCLDNISKEECYTVSECGHKFHKECMKEWVKSTENISCPLCRSNFKSIEVGFKSEFETYLKLKKAPYFGFKKLILGENEIYVSSDSMYTLFKLSPSSWAIHNKDFFQPLYSISSWNLVLALEDELGDSYSHHQISSWLRINLIFGDDREIEVKKQETLDSNYLICEKEFYIRGQKVSYDSYFKIYNWIFEVMHTISSEKQLKYETSSNTHIINIIFTCFQFMNINKFNYQLLGLCAIHLAHKKRLTLKYLAEFINNYYTVEEIESFLERVEREIPVYGL